MPRFVILCHRGAAGYKPGVHWDLMLETAGVLRTWELASEPAISAAPAADQQFDDRAAEYSANDPGEPHAYQLAKQLPDHRLAYLDYEGPISGDRGAVEAWDRGEYRMLIDLPLELVCQLQGGKVAATVRLLRDSLDSTAWRVSWSG